MVITRFSAMLCSWLNKINPKSEEENIVIQYGFELILDNLIKLLFIQLAGVLLGKGWETFFILLSFCALRLLAGGVHAKTNIGCSLGMISVWGLSLIASMFIKIDIPYLVLLYIISILIIACFAPRSKNISYFTYSSIIKRKLFSLLILTFLMIIAFINTGLREIIVCPVTLEVLTLLPKNNTNLKGD